jgi:hypothetical protein
VDQERFADVVPGQDDVCIPRHDALDPEGMWVARFAEFRIADRDRPGM